MRLLAVGDHSGCLKALNFCLLGTRSRLSIFPRRTLVSGRFWSTAGGLSILASLSIAWATPAFAVLGNHDCTCWPSVASCAMRKSRYLLPNFQARWTVISDIEQFASASYWLTWDARLAPDDPRGAAPIWSIKQTRKTRGRGQECCALVDERLPLFSR